MKINFLLVGLAKAQKTKAPEAQAQEAEAQFSNKNSETAEDKAALGKDEYVVKLSKMRWVVLLIFFCNAVLLGINFNNYVMVPDMLKEYFGIADVLISWTMSIFMLCFILLILPLVGFLQKMSLRFTMLCGSGALLIGAILKKGALVFRVIHIINHL